MNSSVEAPDWSTIPAPTDDGAARHLVGTRIASVPLPATDGTAGDLSSLPGRVVVYAYPRTGKPGVENPDGWDLIPGARGCTPQSCSFRDHFAELKALGGQSPVRSFNAGHDLSTGGCRASAPTLSDSLGRTPQTGQSHALADLRDERDDAAETSDACDQRRDDRARLLSSFPAGSGRERGAGVADGQVLGVTQAALAWRGRRRD